MKNVARTIETIANLAIIFIAILLGSVLVKSYLIPNSIVKEIATVPLTQRVIQRGDALNLSDINWQKNGKTLLLALSTTCHYCTESAPFYQRISREHGNTRLIVLLPQEVREGEQYLKRLGVQVDEVRQISLGEIGVTGTPTLTLVDNRGEVVNSWAGQLQPDGENEVLNRLKSEVAQK